MQSIVRHIKQSLQPLYPDSEIKALTGLLLEKRFGIRMLDVYMGKDIQFSPEQAHDLEDILSRMKRHEPVQYILGEAEFCGLSFHVDSRVLIPRPETAELVEWISRDAHFPSCRVVDMGTGSGCIPVTLSKRFPAAEIHAWELSEEALAVAKGNNRRHGTSVRFEQRDILAEEWDGESRFDILVSNPPYIRQSESKEMERNVLDWEPSMALFVPDEDPLRFYRSIARTGRKLLTPAGHLYLEINRLMGEQMTALLKETGYKEIELRKDLSGNDRMIKATR